MFSSGWVLRVWFHLVLLYCSGVYVRFGLIWCDCFCYALAWWVSVKFGLVNFLLLFELNRVWLSVFLSVRGWFNLGRFVLVKLF